MNPLLEEIRSRGYWQTVIRPKSVKPSRLEISGRLVEALRGASVQLRGWDFPHVDFNTRPQIETDSIGQETSWEYFRELWRIFESGQFVHVAGMRHDWDAPIQLGVMERVPDGARLLGMGDTIFRFTEIALFSHAYVRGILQDDPATVTASVAGLDGRYLVVDEQSRGGLSVPHVATTKKPFNVSIEIESSTSQDELLNSAREAARGLFKLFDVEINERVLEDWQGTIGRF